MGNNSKNWGFPFHSHLKWETMEQNKNYDFLEIVPKTIFKFPF